ncbi:MAG: PAS domain-containing protein [Sneathiella sp.]|nr:PAS domain-containing protein [Sneathiella sp.]
MVTFLDYYLKIHPEISLPSRDDFDPFEIPALLQSVTLVDVERNPYRFKYRVMGSNVTYNMEFEGTGKYLDELVPGVETQFPHLDRVTVVESGLPVYRLGEASVSFRADFADLERVHLPLASDGKTVDMVLSAFIYFSDQID